MYSMVPIFYYRVLHSPFISSVLGLISVSHKCLGFSSRDLVFIRHAAVSSRYSDLDHTGNSGN